MRKQLNETAKFQLLKIVKGLKATRNERPLNRKLRVLSIDGGGIRAILPAMMLAELEERLKKESGNPATSIVDHFDLFAGTSAGAILISLYLTPSEDDPQKPRYTAREVLEIYLRDGCASFLPVNLNAPKSRSEKYCANTLEQKLQYLLGKTTHLGQLLKPALITAFNTATETPVYFKSWEKTACETWQVVRASSAAPGMFRPAVVDGYHPGEPLIDGSVFAGNPAMCAYALATSTCFSKIANCSSFKDFPEAKDMVLFSLGTGKEAACAAAQKTSWIRSMMKNLMSSGIGLVDHQLRQLFSAHEKGSYFRFNPTLPTISNDIDNVGTNNVEALCQIGKKYLIENENSMLALVKAVV
ncbi:MAG: patatin-like phospholipase family protein [Bacteroidota bacterium]